MAKTILLADDSVTIQKVVELTFMDQDYEIIAVSDGDTALTRLPELQPVMVIADVHMPGADGYEVCRQTKADHPGIPVLLLVGAFEQFDERRAVEVGADGHLKKPFESESLLGQVEALVGGAAAAPAPAAPAPAAAPDPFPAVGGVAPSAVSDPFGAVPPLEPPQSFAPESAPAFEALAPAVPSFDAPFAGAPLENPAELPAPLAAAPPVSNPLETVSSGDGVAPVTAAPPAAAAPPVPAAPPAAAAPPVPAATADPLATIHSGMVPVPPPAQPFKAPEPAPAPVVAASETVAPIAAEPVAAEPVAAEPVVAEPVATEPVAAEPVAASEPSAADVAPSNGQPALSDGDVDRIARRVVEVMGEKALRDVAWEVIPDLAEVIIRERIRELESQVE